MKERHENGFPSWTKRFIITIIILGTAAAIIAAIYLFK
jgi:hypothetical protein